jgi:hypothetical protein
VVLVEEAGELLEAHVLTSLGPNSQHLIMIGKPQHHSQTLAVRRSPTVLT